MRRTNRRTHRSDANQETIVKALRVAGMRVWVIGKPVDLLVSVRGRNELVEVKAADGDLTQEQEDFIAEWPNKVHVVRSVDEAFRALIPEAMR